MIYAADHVIPSQGVKGGQAERYWDEAYSTGQGIVESQNEGNNAGLPASRLSTQGYCLPRIHDQAEVLEDHDLGPLRVGKFDGP